MERTHYRFALAGNSHDMNPINNNWELTKHLIAKKVITTLRQMIETVSRIHKKAEKFVQRAYRDA